MAEQLETYDFARGKYPWDDWMNGRPWEITHGQDFTCGSRSMKTQIHEEARRRGLGARVRTRGPVIVFESFDPKTETP